MASKFKRAYEAALAPHAVGFILLILSLIGWPLSALTGHGMSRRSSRDSRFDGNLDFSSAMQQDRYSHEPEAQLFQCYSVVQLSGAAQAAVSTAAATQTTPYGYSTGAG